MNGIRLIDTEKSSIKNEFSSQSRFQYGVSSDLSDLERIREMICCL